MLNHLFHGCRFVPCQLSGLRGDVEIQPANSRCDNSHLNFNLLIAYHCRRVVHWLDNRQLITLMCSEMTTQLNAFACDSHAFVSMSLTPIFLIFTIYILHRIATLKFTTYEYAMTQFEWIYASFHRSSLRSDFTIKHRTCVRWKRLGQTRYHSKLIVNTRRLWVSECCAYRNKYRVYH